MDMDGCVLMANALFHKDAVAIRLGIAFPRRPAIGKWTSQAQHQRTHHGVVFEIGMGMVMWFCMWLCELSAN